MTLPAQRTSIRGRELGLDIDRFLTTPNGVRTPKLEFDVTVATTSATLSNGGVSLISTAAAMVMTMAAPIAGAIKHILCNSTSTSTAARTITLASGLLQSTAGSTFTSITINAAGQSAMLVGQSTSRFTVMQNNGCLLA